MLNENVVVGEDILFVEGKKGNPIAFTDLGKVIICKHKIPLGYAKITSVEDKGNYFLVTAEHIVKDYFYNISYEEFLKVLPLHGFKIGFDIPFENDFNKLEEREIFAYNLDNHCIIVAATIDNKSHFNSIDLYCPNMSAFSGNYKRAGFSHGSSYMSVFNLAFRYGTIAKNSLAKFNEEMKEIKETKGVEWEENETPSLWHYGENANNLWENTINRILLADSEVDIIFKNSNRMKPILEKRA